MDIRQSQTNVKTCGLCDFRKWQLAAIKWWPKLNGVLMCRLEKGPLGLVLQVK